MVASEEVAGTYNLLHRYIFDRREDLRLPTLFLMNVRGEIVKVYHEPIAAKVVEDIPRIEVSAAERLTRALPFPGRLFSSPAERSYFQYGLELSEQGFDAPALVVFEGVAKRDPSALTFYNLGTLYMKRQPAKARAAFEHALRLKPDYAEADNSLGALLAESGDIPGAIERFRAALEAKPDFPDALNNLGFALFQTGRADEAYGLYQKALALQPDFPEALNNVGIFFGRQSDLDRAQKYFQEAVDKRKGYGEAATNLALVLSARGEMEKAIAVLQRLLGENAEFEMAYVALSKSISRRAAARMASGCSSSSCSGTPLIRSGSRCSVRFDPEGDGPRRSRRRNRSSWPCCNRRFGAARPGGLGQTRLGNLGGSWRCDGLSCPAPPSTSSILCRPAPG